MHCTFDQYDRKHPNQITKRYIQLAFIPLERQVLGFSSRILHPQFLLYLIDFSLNVQQHVMNQ